MWDERYSAEDYAYGTEPNDFAGIFARVDTVLLGRKSFEAAQAMGAQVRGEAGRLVVAQAALGEADCVICRAGALTVAEVAAAGVAAIFVPFPHAVDDHQTRNARYLADRGAALLMPQPTLTPQLLADALRGLLGRAGQHRFGAMVEGAAERRKETAGARRAGGGPGDAAHQPRPGEGARHP